MAEVEECTHDCNTCGVSCSSREGGAVQNLHEKLNKYSSVKKVIGIVSGKGGVGKSIVTSLMAVMFSRKGYHTAILDADITGPSIPKSFGIKERAMELLTVKKDLAGLRIAVTAGPPPIFVTLSSSLLP